MKIAVVTLAAALSLCVGAAAAQSFDGKTSLVCLEVGGQSVPPTCQVPSSRLDNREDICTCPMGGQRVSIQVCPQGVSPPPESAAYNKARQAAISKGSLAGAMYQGKPMCVAARNALSGH